VAVVGLWERYSRTDVLDNLSVAALHLCQSAGESQSLLFELDEFELVLQRLALLAALVRGWPQWGARLVTRCESRWCLPWNLRARVVYSGLTLDFCVLGAVFVPLLSKPMDPTFLLRSWRWRWRVCEVDSDRVDVLWNNLEFLQGILGTVS
jgi:hypothetical protein